MAHGFGRICCELDATACPITFDEFDEAGFVDRTTSAIQEVDFIAVEI
jgi:hypothetical protein